MAAKSAALGNRDYKSVKTVPYSHTKAEQNPIPHGVDLAFRFQWETMQVRVLLPAPRRRSLRTAQKRQALDASAFSSAVLRVSSFSPRDPLRWARVGFKRCCKKTRTIKETSFVYQGKRGFFVLFGKKSGKIKQNRASERSIGCSGALFFVFSGRNSPKTLVCFLRFFAPVKKRKKLRSYRTRTKNP